MDAKTLETVLNISHHMAQNRNLNPLLNYAMEEAVNLVGAEAGYLVLLESDGTLTFRAAYSRDGSKSAVPDDAISGTILGEVIRTGKPLVLRDAGIDPNFANATSVVLLRLRSVMCVPLLVRGGVIGAIYVENRSIEGRFGEANLPPLLLFANQAAIAIENARLNDELEERIAERTRQLERAITQVETAWQQAVEVNRMHTEWLGKITHDMRAPLSVVISALTLMQEGEFGAVEGEMLEWVTRALDATNRALVLSNNVFDLAKLEMGGLRLYKEPIDPVAFLQGIFNIGMGLPWAEGVSFRLEIPAELPSITIDPGRIHQVIINLLSNALKFTEAGEVVLHAELGSEMLIVGVRDTGNGIALDAQERIFERFYQAPQTLDKRRSGTGLGLAICQELVEAHGGQIWVESEPNAGSDFLFTLPYNAPSS